jgi:uncharacterized membrane protein YhaH (DUF805 family)
MSYSAKVMIAEENGHEAPSHFVLPDELNEHVQWKEELQNDKSKTGRLKYWSLFAIQGLVTAVLLSRYYVSLLFAACISYDTFIKTQNPHEALQNGITTISITALFVELWYIYVIRKSTIYVPILKSRAYVEGGPINISTALYFLFLVAVTIILIVQLLQFQDDCGVKHDSSYNVTITLCNN